MIANQWLNRFALNFLANSLRIGKFAKIAVANCKKVDNNMNDLDVHCRRRINDSEYLQENLIAC